jgi:gliding motility-associated-like protein
MTVNPPVTPTVTVTATPSTICQGQPVTYTINATGTGTSPGFQWLLNGLALPGQTGNTYTNNAITGSDQVSVQMQSNAACVTINPVTSQAVGVTVLAPETPSITLNVNDSIICSNEAPVFTAIFTNGGTSPIFNWYVSGSLVASTATPVFTPVGLGNGQSVACEIVSNYQCATPPAVRSSAISITVSPQPVVEAGADVSTPVGTPVQLNASFNGAYDYLWNPAAGLSCTACINPLASPDVSTTYVVEAIDTLSGCTAFDSLRVEVFELIDIFVPTAFSPNNDQNNDVLFVRGNGIRDIEFTIYNRNGEMIFKSLTQTQGWDGTYKGQDLDSGVFNYLLTGTFKDGNTISQSGNVTLQR